MQSSPEQIIDELKLYCMDCVENPTGWASNRTCTYDYVVGDYNNPQGTYLKITRPQQTLYLLNSNELHICIGCSNLTIVSSDSNIIDDVYNFVTCLSGYYFLNGLCLNCQDNCLSCNFRIFCDACTDGYYLYNGSCIKCPSNCIQCQFNFNISVYGNNPDYINNTSSSNTNKLICMQCATPYVVSQDQSRCSSCGPYCMRCEQEQMVNSKVDYILRCRQCVAYYTFHADGYSCVQTQIQNCTQTYFQISDIYGIRNTDDLSFIPAFSTSTVKQLCRYCTPPLVLSSDSTTCGGHGMLVNCISLQYEQDMSLLCLMCNESPLYTNQCVPLGNDQTFYEIKCNDLISLCNICKQIQNKDNQITYCFSCVTGSYVDYFTNTCANCPYGCSSCYQYTSSYNFTSYLQTGTIVSISARQSYRTQQIQIGCSVCNKGFTLIDGQCYGCDAGCVDQEGASACLIRQTFAFCSACENRLKRSTTSDLLQCQICPSNCLACRDRTYDINPYFTKIYPTLTQYSRLCYLPDTSSTYNSQLGVPIQCNIRNTQTGKCKNIANIDIQLYCDTQIYSQAVHSLTSEQLKYAFDINFFYQNIQNGYSIIQFTSIENVASITLFNQDVYEELNILIELIPDETNQCNIPYNTKILFNFQQTVYSLMKQNITITSKNYATLNIGGKFVFPDYQYLNFVNLGFNLYQSQSFLLVNGSQPNSLFLYKCYIISKYNAHSISFQNINNFTLVNVVLTQLTINNSVAQFYQPSLQSPQTIIISNLSFVNVYIAQSVIFPIINTQANITIKHLLLAYTSINDSSIFKDQTQNESQISGYLKITKLNITNCILGNANVFNLLVMQSVVINDLSVTSSNMNLSLIIGTNTLHVNGLMVRYNQLIQQSVIIQAFLNNGRFQMKKGYFSENSCSDGNCLIACQGSSTENIKLSQIYINSIVPTQNTMGLSFTTNSALIYFIVVKNITINDIQIDNLISFPIFYLNTFSHLNITKFSYNWSQQTDNKLMPATQDCLKYKYDNKQYNYYGIYISNFVNSIYLEQFVLENLISIDNTFIYIKSYEILEKLTSSDSSEQITMQDFYIMNTSLIIYSMNNYVANIMIDSRQVQDINVKNFVFKNNHLIQLLDGTVNAAAVGFVIRNNLANVTISNVKSYANRATNTQLGVLYVFSTNLYMDNIIFQDTNIYDPSWNTRFYNFRDPSLFNIQSSGANMIIVCQILILDNCIFNNTISNQAGLNINFNLNLTAIFKNTSFIRQYTSLSEFSSGGAIYINCNGGLLSVLIQNSTFQECVAAQYGAALAINPPSNHESNISIQNSEFIRCQALYGIITVQFQSPSLSSVICISKSNFIKNGLDQLIANLNTLSSGQLATMMNTGTVIHQEYGSLIIQDCTFRNQTLISIIKAIQLTKVYISRSTFEQNRIFDAQLIQVTSNSYNYIQLIDLRFVANSINQIKQQVYQTVDSTTVIQGINNSRTYNTCFPVTFISYNNAQSSDSYRFPLFRLSDNYGYVQPSDLSNYFDWDVKDTFFLNAFLNYNYTIDSLVSLTLSSTTRLELLRLTIDKNTCHKCSSGFISIYNILGLYVSIIELDCVNNQLGYYGCLYLSQGTIQSVQNKFPLYQRVLQEIEYGVQINSSRFECNIASYGAGFSAFDVIVYVTNSTFINNEARYIGGSIYFQASGTRLILNNNIFNNNRAQVAPAIFARNQTISMYDNQINDNWSTQYLAQNEDQPARLTIRMNNNTQFQLNPGQNFDEVDVRGSTGIQTPHNIIYLPSGQAISKYTKYDSYTQENIPYEWIFRVLNLSFRERMIATGQQTDYCSLSARTQNFNNYSDTLPYNTNYTNPDQVWFDETLGMYNLDELVITFDPYQDENLYLELRIQCSSIKPVAVNNNYALYLNIKTLPCQIGEAYSQQQCKQCASGTYSVDLTSRICLNQDTRSMLNVTATRINVSPCFYRYSESTSIPESCVNLPKNCNGGWDTGDMSCFLGHSGALCESCDIYARKTSEPYAYAGDYACAPCSEVAKYNTVVIVLISLFTMAALVYSVIGNLESMAKFVKKKIKISLRIQVSSDNISVLIKLFINYIQIISALTQFKIQIPNALISSFQAMGSPLKSMGYSFDCFLVVISDLPIIYMRILWSLVVPISYIVMFLIVYFGLVITNRVDFKIGVIYTTFIYMFIYLQPNYVGSFIQLVSSRIISAIYWVQADVNYKYYTDTHNTWLLRWVIPNLIGWSLVIPVFLILKLRTIKRDNIQCRIRWGYLYNEYTDGAYLWEFMKMYQRVFVIMSLSYYQDQVVVKGQLIFFIIFLYGVCTYRFTPYTRKNLNQIDRKSTVVCGASMAIGVLIYSCQQSALQYLELMMFFWIIALNLFFLIQMLVAVLQGYINKAQGPLDLLRDRINKRFPTLIHKNKCLRHLLMNRGQLQQRARDHWAELRFRTRQGIKRHREDKSKPIFEFSNRIEYIHDIENIQLIHSGTPSRPEESLSPTIEDNKRQIVRYFNQLINRSPSRKQSN